MNFNFPLMVDFNLNVMIFQIRHSDYPENVEDLDEEEEISENFISTSRKQYLDITCGIYTCIIEYCKNCSFLRNLM